MDRPNHQFTIERWVRHPDARDDADELKKLAVVWGHLDTGTGSEPTTGDQVTAIVARTARIPFRENLRPDDRIVDKWGAVNEITSIEIDEDMYRTPWLVLRLVRTGQHVGPKYQLIGIGESIPRTYYLDGESLQVLYDEDGNALYQ